MSRLSICVTVKNRSSVKTDDGTLYLFPDLIRSIANSITLDKDVELVIVDWASTDWPIKLWIEEYIPSIPIHLINIQSNKFSIGRGKNIAAAHATGNKIFFVDADMIVNKEVIDFAFGNVFDGTVYYPTVHYYNTKTDYVIHEGGGNFFINKSDFEKTNKWPEYYAHGFDDVDFYKEISTKYKILTHPTLYIDHQYHPQSKDFKDRFATQEGKDKINERRQFYLDEKEVLKKEAEIFLHAPNTTHYKLNPPAKGI